NRDLSGLAFNDRVLQEAKDARNPLHERVKFLAIYSSNLDEFYRVRVASLRSLARLGKATRAALDLPPERLIARINAKALQQQREFGALWRGTLLPALHRKGIRLLDDDELSARQRRFVERFAEQRILPRLSTAVVREGNAPFIEDRRLYFVCRVGGHGKRGKERLVLVNIPSEELGRFIALPSAPGKSDLLFLDDAVRLCLPKLFASHRVLAAHAIKLSRDAELYLDEEYAGSVKEKVRKSLRKRRTGVPARLLYDAAMPKRTVRAMRELLHLAKDDLVQGGRYHHFSDLLQLPVKGHAALHDKPWPPLRHPALARQGVFAAADKRDLLLHFPYHDFGQVVEWLQQAARDRQVRRIRITLYRVAPESAVCMALLEALRRGKQVEAFVEVQARFDEGHNLTWGERLEAAGAQVNYGFEGLKVHCKLCLIERSERGGMRRYAYLGTGNFNERTARLYTDAALITADRALCDEVAEVFRHLADRNHRPRNRRLLVAPMGLRDGLEALIDGEIRNAALGRPAGITLKVNNLEDRSIIAKLYDASQAGVPVRLIVRGICCLVPGVAGLSDRIEAISIVDRFLEHTRAYLFLNGGDPKVYLSSADWMGRNLDHRVEVAFPVQDAALREEVLRLIELQWADRTKARIIDELQRNAYRRPRRGEAPKHAQRDIYRWLRAASRRSD
ncbi:MAG: polyphosphate kinase 1, partial [Flavobacteriales bacterium]